jgi:hypothetical protein
VQQVPGCPILLSGTPPPPPVLGRYTKDERAPVRCVREKQRECAPGQPPSAVAAASSSSSPPPPPPSPPPHVTELNLLHRITSACLTSRYTTNIKPCARSYINGNSWLGGGGRIQPRNVARPSGRGRFIDPRSLHFCKTQVVVLISCW